MKLDRERALELIKHNIAKCGFHICLIAAGPSPRFAYTSGLRGSLGAELVLAGAVYYEKGEILEILRSVREQLAAGINGELGPLWTLVVPRLGSFTVRRVHSSWTNELLSGAMDYYGTKEIGTYQIVPEEKHLTLGVPNMAKDWSRTCEPVWQWLQDETWTYSIPRGSEAMVDPGRAARSTGHRGVPMGRRLLGAFRRNGPRRVQPRREACATCMAPCGRSVAGRGC